MMTPKEVQEHGFPRSRKGYDMAEVDDFLDKLTEDYTALYTNYGKLSNSYAKLRKKAQALAAALEQSQNAAKAAPKQVEAAKPAPKPQAVSVAGQDAVDELLRAARKDAEAIRAGAERERQEIINQATNYAAENAERLKGEVAQEEARLAAIKKATADYVRQVRQLMGRQTTLLDSMPVQDEDYAPAAVAELQDEVEAEAETGDEMDEPTLRVEENTSDVADEISRNMMSLNFDDEDDGEEAADSDLDATGSLFDVIAGADSGEFDEE
jgi:cell division initiation protein